MFIRPKSERIEREAEALAKWQDPELADERRRKAYGDSLDKVGLRNAALSFASMFLLVAGVVMFIGETFFAWKAGNDLFPQVEWNGAKVGGALTVANSFGFLWLVKLYMSVRQRVVLPPKSTASQYAGAHFRSFTANRYGVPMLLSFLFAFFCVYVSQSNAADEVRRTVDRRDALEQEIGQLTADIDGTFIQHREPVRVSLEDAQDEAVGWRLNTVTQDEAAQACAEVGGLFEDQMACRRKMLRDSLNFTQDIDPRARDVVNRVNLYKTQLARIDEQEAELARKVQTRKDRQAELKNLPDVTNAFVKAISDMTGWELPDAQAKVYVALALTFLLLPAILFALTLAKVPLPRDDAEPVT